jgi:hypothetical protein
MHGDRAMASLRTDLCTDMIYNVQGSFLWPLRRLCMPLSNRPPSFVVPNPLALCIPLSDDFVSAYLSRLFLYFPGLLVVADHVF